MLLILYVIAKERQVFEIIVWNCCIKQKKENCDISLDSVTGTYCGKLPSNVETTLTLNGDETYLLIRTFKEKQNEREKLRGTFQVLEGNILMFVHPLSGDNKFYKVRDANHIILMDSFGNEPQKEDRKDSILKKKD